MNDKSTLLYPNFYFKSELGDHFDLLTILFSPFYLVFGSWTLLLIQIIAIIAGGIGVYKIIEKLASTKLANWAAIHFYSVWGIYSALSFDFHQNVIAAMFVPWLIYFFILNKKWQASIFLVLILFAKENMALWAVFISLGLAIWFYKEKEKRILAFIFAGVAATYFILVLKIFIPYFAGENNSYIHFRYAALGSTMGEAVKTIVLHPQYSFSLLFENFSNEPIADGIKSELFFMILLSGGIALIYKPQFLIMLVPILAQKLFNNEFGKWGINNQYSIELVPILSLSLFIWIKDFSKERLKKTAAIIATLLCIAANIASMDSRVSKWYNATNTRFYAPAHYKQSYDVNKIKEELKTIPDDAKVSAQSNVVPRLTSRKVIYLYPFIGDANYIVLLPSEENTYPIYKEEFDTKLDTLRNSATWVEIIDNKDILIFKRK